MNIGIVYSKNQSVIRRVIKLDHAGACAAHHEPHKKNLHVMEGWLEIPQEIYDTLDAAGLEAHVAKIIGEKKDDRCKVICPITGDCKHIIHADPDIDFHPDGKIVRHE